MGTSVYPSTQSIGRRCRLSFCSSSSRFFYLHQTLKKAKKKYQHHVKKSMEGVFLFRCHLMNVLVAQDGLVGLRAVLLYVLYVVSQIVLFQLDHVDSSHVADVYHLRNNAHEEQNLQKHSVLVLWL